MIPIRRVSVEKDCKQLNWTPKVSLEEGVLKTYQWMKKQLGHESGITGMYD
jgi:nucleoside-diphosphate-sugar epimerase